MSDRPTTRADLRQVAWWWLRRVPRHPALTASALRLLAALDADERDDTGAAESVAAYLSHTVVTTDPDGHFVGLCQRHAEPAR
jgi:hypothetical protein